MITQRAIELAGNAAALAEMLGITQSAVSQWGEQVPDGRIWQLRVIKPDWFDANGHLKPAPTTFTRSNGEVVTDQRKAVEGA